MENLLEIARPASQTRVVVAMSGGVDSSVVAGLLAAEGFEVIGVTLQLYDHGAAVRRKGACCAGQDIDDARRVAATLGISHYVLDYESRFREAVIEDFADAYLRGETPVPCVTCNQTVKFEDLINVARDLGADALATGHYVRSVRQGNRRILLRPADTHRDQSYFLFATTQDQLDYLRFPLGGLSKTETRALAEKMGLLVANKSDSQDICFVPEGRYSDVILKLRPEAANPGDIVHADGRVLGRHAGIINFTVGQRRGLGVSAGEPLFVLRLDAEKKQVVVGPKSALGTDMLILRDVNWLGDLALEDIGSQGIEIEVRVRSTRPPTPARLTVEHGVARVQLLAAEHGVSPGQACVFYRGDGTGAQVLGGGWIVRTEGMASAA
jgi:tRNA-uridine 2-sulfurtransferase